MARTLYEVLGISQDFDFENPDALKNIYRKLQREYHPDLHPNEKEKYTAKSAEINEAYEILSDRGKRAKYDREIAMSRLRDQFSQDGSSSGPEVTIYYNPGEDFYSGPQSTSVPDFFNILQQFQQQAYGKQTLFSRSVRISLYDMQILSAWIDALRVNHDGQWQISKMSQDSRDWMPPVLAVVDKHRGVPRLFRVVSDFRRMHKIDTQIHYKPSPEEDFRPEDRHTLFDLNVLSQPDLHFGTKDVKLPANYYTHYETLFSVARKLIQLDQGRAINLRNELQLLESDAQERAKILNELDISPNNREPMLRFPYDDLPLMYKEYRQYLGFSRETYGGSKEKK